MSNRIKAAFITTGMLAVSALGIGAVQVIAEYFTPEQLLNILVLGLVVFMVGCMYQITLGRLDYEDRLKKLNESIKNKG